MHLYVYIFLLSIFIILTVLLLAIIHDQEYYIKQKIKEFKEEFPETDFSDHVQIIFCFILLYVWLILPIIMLMWG